VFCVAFCVHAPCSCLFNEPESNLRSMVLVVFLTLQETSPFSLNPRDMNSSVTFPLHTCILLVCFSLTAFLMHSVSFLLSPNPMYRYVDLDELIRNQSKTMGRGLKLMRTRTKANSSLCSTCRRVHAVSYCSCPFGLELLWSTDLNCCLVIASCICLRLVSFRFT
jgi:hypothetical protein